MFKPIFLQPSYPSNLAFLRITISIISLSFLYVIRGDIFFIYGRNGLISNEVNAVLSDSIFTIENLRFLLKINGENDVSFLMVYFGVFVFFLICLLLGFLTRLSAFILWIMHSCMINSSPTIMYGFDTFTSNCFLYCILMPTNYVFSIDKLLFFKARSSILQNGLFFTRILQLHLCIIYFFSGINKSFSIEWWNGEAIWRAINQPPLRVFDMSCLADFSWLMVMLGIGTLVIEICYPFFIFNRKTKKLWLTLTILLHIGIAIFLNLYFFALIMIMMNLAGFGYNEIKNLFSELSYSSLFLPNSNSSTKLN